MKRTYVRPTMVGERFVAKDLWQMSMWQLVMTRIQCISLNVMHQVDGYIIIQGLMERLMEYTIKTIELKF